MNQRRRVYGKILTVRNRIMNRVFPENDNVDRRNTKKDVLMLLFLCLSGIVLSMTSGFRNSNFFVVFTSLGVSGLARKISSLCVLLFIFMVYPLSSYLFTFLDFVKTKNLPSLLQVDTLLSLHSLFFHWLSVFVLSRESWWF